MKATPAIHIEPITIERGDETVATVTATAVQMLHVARPSANDEQVLKPEGETVTPHWDTILLSYPPYWVWDSQQDQITAKFPVRTTMDTAPTTYHYPVHAWTHREHHKDPDVTRDIAITVT